MKRIDALQGGIMLNGAKIPLGWGLALEQAAFDQRVTRAELVRSILTAWLKKHPEHNDVQTAAEAHNRSYSQQVRQILEDEVPHLCPPIQEWRGDGARHSRAIRAGRVSHKLTPTVTLKLPAYVEGYLRKLAKGKPDVYATHEDVATRILTKWVEAQLAKDEGQKA